MIQFRFGNYRCQCLSPLLSFTKSTIPKESCRSNNHKPWVSYSATYQSHALLILSCQHTCVVILHKLSFTLVMGNHSFPPGAGKYRIFFYSLKDNDWWSISIEEMLNYLFVLDFITKFLRKMCLSKRGSFFPNETLSEFRIQITDGLQQSANFKYQKICSSRWLCLMTFLDNQD